MREGGQAREAPEYRSKQSCTSSAKRTKKGTSGWKRQNERAGTRAMGRRRLATTLQAARLVRKSLLNGSRRLVSVTR